MSFAPGSPSLDLVALEDTVLSRWETDDVFHESLSRRADAPEWVFYEGPPTANGRPGIHHVWARLFKDIYPRFHTMSGKHIARQAGWDCDSRPGGFGAGQALCERYRQVLAACLMPGFSGTEEENLHIGDLARMLRTLSGRYDQGARAASSI